MKTHLHDIHLCLSIEPEIEPVFFQFLAQGFKIKGRTNCSIKELLCQQLQMDVDYVNQRIQTIFLNGKAVDDIRTTNITNGSTLALSAAMPGLVGATFRKGGKYSNMRSNISMQEDINSDNLTSSRNKTGEFTLKLFNLIAGEIGPTFLRQGIWINGKNLQDFIHRQSDRFWKGCKDIYINGQLFDQDELLGQEWKSIDVCLSIQIYT